MITQQKVLTFLEGNKALSLTSLEKEAGISTGLISKVNKGERNLNNSHLEKLLPILIKYGYRETSFKDGTARTIAVCNHKGGVSKTTTSLNLGKGLSLRGYKVLVVDMDAQANLTSNVGIELSKTSVFDEGGDSPKNLSENFDIICSNIEIYDYEDSLRNEFDAFDKLNKILAPLKSQYDFIIIDTPPSLGIFTSNAIIACDDVLIPTQTQSHSVSGLVKIVDLINKVNIQKELSIRILGILLTQTTKTIASQHVTDELKSQFNEYILKTTIPTNVALQEATITKQDIFSYDEKSKGALSYFELVDEILKKYEL